ncbi:MAG: hypothetical protein WC860_07420 [Candidatus Margulisiibacteriota bacterium]|jgi:hypothetical protein
MNETSEELRLRFEAETDIQIDEKLLDWKPYAIWLENLAIQQVNNEIITENNKLREAYWKVIDLLDNILAKRI